MFAKFGTLLFNVCTTARQEFPQLYGLGDRMLEIMPYWSINRFGRFVQLAQQFTRDMQDENRIPILFINELRTYNVDMYINVLKSMGYKLLISKNYPNVDTERLSYRKVLSDEELRETRFSFINGIAIPEQLTLVSMNSFELTGKSEPSGSRRVLHVQVQHGNSEILNLYCTQFGMATNERLKSAQVLADIIGDTEFAIIQGDFNSFHDEKGDVQMKILDTKLPLLERVTPKLVDQNGRSIDGTFIGMRPVEKPEFCIDINTGKFNPSILDHVFLPRKYIMDYDCYAVVPESEEERIYPISDHTPIITRFEMTI